MAMDKRKIKYLVKVLERIQNQPEKLKEKEIKRINPGRWTFFQQYCLTEKDPLVGVHPGGFKLKEAGHRKLDELKILLSTLEHQEDTRKNQNVQSLAAMIIAAGVLYSLVTEGAKGWIAFIIVVLAILAFLIFFRLVET